MIHYNTTSLANEVIVTGKESKLGSGVVVLPVARAIATHASTSNSVTPTPHLSVDGLRESADALTRAVRVANLYVGRKTSNDINSFGQYRDLQTTCKVAANEISYVLGAGEVNGFSITNDNSTYTVPVLTIDIQHPQMDVGCNADRLLFAISMLCQSIKNTLAANSMRITHTIASSYIRKTSIDNVTPFHHDSDISQIPFPFTLGYLGDATTASRFSDYIDSFRPSVCCGVSV